MSGGFHGHRSLVGYSPWGCKELNMTEWLTLSFFIYLVVLGLRCSMGDLVPWPGMKLGLPALGMWSQPLDHQGSPLGSSSTDILHVLSVQLRGAADELDTGSPGSWQSEVTCLDGHQGGVGVTEWAQRWPRRSGQLGEGWWRGLSPRVWLGGLAVSLHPPEALLLCQKLKSPKESVAFRNTEGPFSHHQMVGCLGLSLRAGMSSRFWESPRSGSPVWPSRAW